MSRRKLEFLEGIPDVLDRDEFSFGNVIVRPKRAAEIFGMIYDDAIGRSGFFKHIHRERNAPQRIYFPEGTEKGDPDHRVWLFFAAGTDRRGQSNRIYSGYRELWKKHRKLYSPSVVDIPSDEIVDLIGGERLGLHKNIIVNWTNIARTLFFVLDGEPLRVYEGGSVNSIIYPEKGTLKLHLPGFGPKILSLLATFYEELGLIEMPRDAFPVDLHVQRIAISTGILDSSDGLIGNEQAEMLLRFLICLLAERYDWSKVELSNALWLLGNQGCSGCYRKAIMSHYCPVYMQCTGAIDSGGYYAGKWDLKRMFRKSGGSGKMFPDDLPLMQFASDD